MKHQDLKFIFFILMIGISVSAQPDKYTPSQEDIAFLEELEKRCFLFFWEEADTRTGLISDRADADGKGSFPIASIASTGFGLAGLCVGEKRGWISRNEAYERGRKTLRFIWETMQHKRGFFYHFVNKKTGRRHRKSEISSIDTGLLLAGAMTLGQYFKGTEIERLVNQIYERVNFQWMLNDGETLVMGWRPESGFGKARWASYNEHLFLTLLALGSPTYPVPGIWDNWRRNRSVTYGGRTFLSCPPLFTHQYSQAFVDFKNKRDAYADYWQNSVLMTLAQREFCVDMRPEFPEYNENMWGLTASAGPKGYKVWGGPPRTIGKKSIDGSVVPCAPGGSIPFAPQVCISTLRNMYEQHKNRVWKYYGFVDAYNPNTRWNSTDVIGIDVGAMLLMIENYRSGLIWKYFNRNTSIRLALYRAGFVKTDKKLSEKETAYLNTLSRHTWQCINQFKLKTDTPEKMGWYLSDIVAAHSLGFISRTNALERIQQIFQNLPVKISGMLTASVLTAIRAFPELGASSVSYMERLSWDTKLTDLMSPERLGYYMSIAAGKNSPDAWGYLSRQNYPENIEATLPQIWLNERGTYMGRMTENIFYNQIIHARKKKFPVWGFKNKNESQVFPAIAASALEHFPKETLRVLKILERIRVRHPKYGFYESVNPLNKTVRKKFSLRFQSLLFLNLTNFLTEKNIRYYFHSEPVIQEARKKINEFKIQKYGDNNSLYTMDWPPADIRGKTIMQSMFNSRE